MMEALKNYLTFPHELYSNSIVEYSGLEIIIGSKMFRFVLCSVLKLLNTISPAEGREDKHLVCLLYGLYIYV